MVVTYALFCICAAICSGFNSVTSDGRGKGKGLGLYVAAYYSRLMGYGLKVDNIENGVQVKKVEE